MRAMRTETFRLSGELDAHVAARIRAELHELIERRPRVVVVDLGAVTFLDSTILGLLVGGLRRMREQGGDLRLVFPPEPARRIFSFTGLDNVFAESDPAGSG